jgi:hypothetical protein
MEVARRAKVLRMRVQETPTVILIIPLVHQGDVQNMLVARISQTGMTMLHCFVLKIPRVSLLMEISVALP